MIPLYSPGIPTQKSPQEPSPSIPCSYTEQAVAAQPGQRGCKRKRDGDNKNVAIGEPFTIETQPRGLPFLSTTLSPLLVIPRSCLPLAYLDLAGNPHRTPGTQLFSANLPTLEKILQGNTRDHPVLIARACSVTATLFAIESVNTGLYALCPLGQWVTIDALKQLHAESVKEIAPKKHRHERVNPQDSDWWRDLAIKDDGVFQLRSDREDTEIPRDVRLCLKARRPAEHTPVLDTLQSPLYVTKETIPMTVDGCTNGDSYEPSTRTKEDFTNEEEPCLLPTQTTEDVLSMLRIQYQENLYISKTSLAYFAKGPLSRARASLRNKAASSASLLELIVYLRSSIMSTATMDKKYKEAIPSIIDTLPADTLAEDDVTTVIAELQKKLRKTKKLKIGKDGLFPGEDLNISRWWLSRDTEPHDDAEDSMKASLLELRARETQMQIIFLLEALALEASMPTAEIDDTASKDPSQWENVESQTKKRKAKRPQDLNVLLDLFVDRLCIWQSMRIDDSNLNKTAGAQPSTSNDSGIGTDALKSFCVDVVLPFYGGRLPETSNMLRQKLGGTKTPSPMRPPLVKAASSSQLAKKPGTTIKGPGVRKPRATLERVLTDERTASQRRVPGLSRSKTDSALPGLKREVSDTSLTAISLNKVALHKSKRYSQREVDPRGLFQAVEAKLKKKASVEQELRGAIATMRRPNPRMAVKELVDTAERRVAGSHSRKTKNPVRNLFAQGVQVIATPKGNRRKDVFGGLPRSQQPSQVLEPELEEIPPSSISRVPPSIQRSSVPWSAVPRSRDHLPPLLARSAQPLIEHTPTRVPSKFAPNLLDPDPSSKAYLNFLTPSKSRRSMSASESRPISDPYDTRQPPIYHTLNPQSLQQSNTNHSNIQETPLKPQAKAVQKHKPPAECITITSSPPPTGNGPSIYDTLGWNDFDEVL